MSYIALYREWRPKTFNNILGQEHITKILKNQIKYGRIAHAYLFCGTRGTGKTTTAKVLAKAVNCLHSVDGEPCGECEICVGIENGSIMDVVEIDAASNNGVDNIRELRDDVKYLPSKCRYKVYIIDEVHMLSSSAFNALLKTLEEPPAHIIFILATTEYQKVPATILSRCQRFDFKRIRVPDIINRLKMIAQDADIKVDERSLNLIARSADGALRDALSIFDQCISLGSGNVTYDDVSSILGITTDEYLFKITEAISTQNVSKCIALIDELIINGKDVYQFIKDLVMHFRSLLICKMGESALEILNVSIEVFEELKVQTKKFSTEEIIKNINILSIAEADAKWSSQPRIILEMAAIKMCKKELNTDANSLLDRIAKLENIISDKSSFVSNNINQNIQNDKEKNKAEDTQKKTKPSLRESEVKQDQSFQKLLNKWPEIIRSINKDGYMILYSNIIQGKPISLMNGVLTIGFESEFAKKQLENIDNKKLVENYISSICNQSIKLHCMLVDEVAVDKQQNQEEDIIKKAVSIFGEELIQVEE